MEVFGDDPWLDGDAGRLVRPYTVSNGRTRPSKNLDLLSMVLSTGQVASVHLGLDHAQALGLCAYPVSVAEVAAHLGLPAVVTKVILSDLVDCGAVTTQDPGSTDLNDRFILERLLDGLQKRL